MRSETLLESFVNAAKEAFIVPPNLCTFPSAVAILTSDFETRTGCALALMERISEAKKRRQVDEQPDIATAAHADKKVAFRSEIGCTTLFCQLLSEPLDLTTGALEMVISWSLDEKNLSGIIATSIFRAIRLHSMHHPISSTTKALSQTLDSRLETVFGGESLRLARQEVKSLFEM